MIHPETQKLLNYPSTKGKRFAMEEYNWQNLTKVEEARCADEIVRLAKRIDKNF
jgi:hypothetical protein